MRNAHAARFNYDLDAIFLDIKKREKESGLNFVLGVARQPLPDAERKAERKEKEDAANKLTSIALFDRQFSPPNGKSWYLVGIIASLASVV